MMWTVKDRFVTFWRDDMRFLVFSGLSLTLLLSCSPGGQNQSGSSISIPTRQEIPPGTIPAHWISAREGGLSFETNPTKPYSAIRYVRNGSAISRNEFIDLLTKEDAEGQDFRFLVNLSIAKLPERKSEGNSYMLQAPVIDASVKDEMFYFIAIKTNIGHGGTTFNDYLLHCNPSPIIPPLAPTEYTNRFWHLFAATPLGFTVQNTEALAPFTQHAFGAVVFKGGVPPAIHPYEIMVSPCPIDGVMASPKNEPLGHIYSFATYVNDKSDAAKMARLQSFWFAVGKTAQQMFDGALVKDLDGILKTELFLSTHGAGVPYLHFRVENVANYYYQVPDLKKAVPSINYYNKAFSGS